MIYFVQSGPSGPVKIGYARLIAPRVRMLQIGNPSELILVGVMKGGRAEELALHRRFAPLRIRGSWYTPAPEILNLAQAPSAKLVEACRTCLKAGRQPPGSVHVWTKIREAEAA